MADWRPWRTPSILVIPCLPSSSHKMGWWARVTVTYDIDIRSYGFVSKGGIPRLQTHSLASKHSRIAMNEVGDLIFRLSDIYLRIFGVWPRTNHLDMHHYASQALFDKPHGKWAKMLELCISWMGLR
jgi:hypothetical protein